MTLRYSEQEWRTVRHPTVNARLAASKESSALLVTRMAYCSIAVGLLVVAFTVVALFLMGVALLELSDKLRLRLSRPASEERCAIWELRRRYYSKQRQVWIANTFLPLALGTLLRIAVSLSPSEDQVDLGGDGV